MEKYQEDRLEPEVGVIHEPGDHPSPSGYPKITRPPSKKKGGVVLISIILVGVAFLVMGLWVVISAGFIPFQPFQKQSESPEFKALKEEFQKLRAETDPLKKEIQSLQEGRKTLQEQVTALKDQLTVLARKSEGLGGKKEAPKAIVYKTQKGDTLNSIANKFHVRPEEIRRWNRLPSKGKPQPGQNITIYSPTP
jgi:LysM repeat protein